MYFQENQPHLPPISTPGASPQNITIGSSVKENLPYSNHPLKRKEIRTPYVSHINRVNDVTTPYVLHTQITNIDPAVSFPREQSKLSKYSGNVVEHRHDPDTFSSLQKLPMSTSPSLERRPRGRHGRKSNSFNEHDIERTIDIKDLTVQSNQMGLYKRADRKQRDSGRAKADESFSIRKKIEQFRRWHEEQNREKIKKLKQEVDHQFEAEHIKVSRQVGGPLRDTPTSKNDWSYTDNEKDNSNESPEKMDDDKEILAIVSANDNLKPRSGSARTWRTWRNANDSYAYTDVHKYIKENELMDDEKAVWIKKWILEVNKAMRDHHPESAL